MSIASLGGILKIFRGSEPTEEEREQLAAEVMLMTLARATAADTNIQAVEVDTVCRVLKRRTGEDIPAADVRVAASSRIYEDAPLAKYVSASSVKLKDKDRLEIAQALAEVIKSDGRVSSHEVEFFDNIANALRLTPSELIGLNDIS